MGEAGTLLTSAGGWALGGGNKVVVLGVAAIASRLFGASPLFCAVRVCCDASAEHGAAAVQQQQRRRVRNCGRMADLVSATGWHLC